MDKTKPAVILKEARAVIESASSYTALEEARIHFLGRKGPVAALMSALALHAGDEKKILGIRLNALKADIEALLGARHAALDAEQDDILAREEAIDVTQDALPRVPRGHAHPLRSVMGELERVFTSMGFMVLDGPELESDYYNFEALNIPVGHPARDIQDTFYIKHHPNRVMRTHTSPVQVRAMRAYGAPLRTVVIGRVFRNEATDASHEHTFHQIEGLVIDRGITMAHLKGTLLTMLGAVLGDDVRIRLRPSYFPFTEPSVEIDVSCTICKGTLCGACKRTGWMELLGAGMVHPRVLSAGGVDGTRYTGFAFGTGIERLAMLRFGIEDVRHFHESAGAFLKQF